MDMNSKVVGGRRILEKPEREKDRIRSQIFRDPFRVSRIWFSPHPACSKATTLSSSIHLSPLSHFIYSFYLNFLSLFDEISASLSAFWSHHSCTFVRCSPNLFHPQTQNLMPLFLFLAYNWHRENWKYCFFTLMKILFTLSSFFLT